MFIYQKTIDRSTLRQGFQIPVEFHDQLKAMPGGMPRHGESRDIKLLIDGQEFTAQLTFHYSDYRTNGTTQTKPHAWEGCSFDALCDSVYAYTFSFLKRMEAQRTTPQ